MEKAQREHARARFTAQATPRLPLALRATEVWLMDNASGRWERRQAFRLGKANIFRTKEE